MDREDRALARLALHADVAPHQRQKLRLMTSPSPVPSYFLVVPVQLTERLEQLAQLLRGHADARVAHPEQQPLAAAPSAAAP